MNRLGTAFWPGPRGSWQRCLAFSVASLLCCFLGLSTRAAESEARQVTPPPALKGRCPTATGSLRHHGLREGSARWKETRLIQLNSAPGTNSAHTIWDTALYDPDQGVVQTALNVFGNRAIPRELSVEEFIWIQSRVATAPSGEATAWAYALANSGLATNALIISVIAERYVADVRSPPPKAGNVGGGGAYLKGEAFFYTQWPLALTRIDPGLLMRSDPPGRRAEGFPFQGGKLRGKENPCPTSTAEGRSGRTRALFQTSAFIVRAWLFCNADRGGISIRPGVVSG
jgi:hypothetical protein